MPVSQRCLPAGAEDRLGWLPDLVAPYGTLGAVWLSKNPKAPLVIHVQDAHQSLDAQRSQAGLLEALGARGLRLVGLEGASGGFGLDPYRSFVNRDVRRGAADLLLRLGYIGGAEFVGFSAETPPLLWGVETPGLYRQNLLAFGDSEKKRSRLLGGLADLRTLSEEAAVRLYSLELKEFDARSTAYIAGRETLAAHVRYLWESFPVSAGPYPNLSLLHQALDAEGKIDFKAVESERRDLMEILVRRLSPADLKKVLDQSVHYRLGRLSQADYHEFLGSLAERNGIRLHGFTHVNGYLSYLGLAEKIDRGSLLTEIDSLERAVESRLARTPEEKSLTKTRRALALLDKLARHAMTPEDWRAYPAVKNALPSLPRILGGLSRRPAPPDDEVLTPAFLQPFEDFSSRAIQRNDSLVENLLDKMRLKKAPMAVLVAGGFHTEGLASRLKKADVSYAVVTPRLADFSQDSRPLPLLVRDPLPLEKLLAGDVITLQSPRLSAESIPVVPDPMVQRVRFEKAAMDGVFTLACSSLGFLIDGKVPETPPGLSIAATTAGETRAGGLVSHLTVRLRSSFGKGKEHTLSVAVAFKTHIAKDSALFQSAGFPGDPLSEQTLSTPRGDAVFRVYPAKEESPSWFNNGASAAGMWGAQLQRLFLRPIGSSEDAGAEAGAPDVSKGALAQEGIGRNTRWGWLHSTWTPLLVVGIGAVFGIHWVSMAAMLILSLAARLALPVPPRSTGKNLGSLATLAVMAGGAVAWAAGYHFSDLGAWGWAVFGMVHPGTFWAEVQTWPEWKTKTVVLPNGHEVLVAINPNGKNRPMVWVPGGGADPSLGRQRALFANYRALIVPKRGPLPAPDTLVSETAADLIQVMKGLKNAAGRSLVERGFHAVGHSLGALTLFHLVSEEDPWVRQRLLSVTLLNPAVPHLVRYERILLGIKGARAMVGWAARALHSASRFVSGPPRADRDVDRLASSLDQAALPFLSGMWEVLMGRPLLPRSQFRDLAHIENEALAVGRFLRDRFPGIEEKVITRLKGLPLLLVYSPQDFLSAGIVGLAESITGDNRSIVVLVKAAGKVNPLTMHSLHGSEEYASDVNQAILDFTRKVETPPATAQIGRRTLIQIVRKRFAGVWVLTMGDLQGNELGQVFPYLHSRTVGDSISALAGWKRGTSSGFSLFEQVFGDYLKAHAAEIPEVLLFSERIFDFRGGAGANFIAVHEDLASSPTSDPLTADLAVFHEFGEHLVAAKKMQFRYDPRSRSLRVILGAKIHSLQLINDRAAVYAARAQAAGGEGKAHDFLRALQIEWFGTIDANLTRTIRESIRQSRLAAVAPANVLKRDAALAEAWEALPSPFSSGFLSGVRLILDRASGPPPRSIQRTSM
ncbi:MAG: alpha/beta hydrolase [Elusimicrobia bacterium]|nr:alpha/beta hydrolase [Elusimicrobiota bacterium]